MAVPKRYETASGATRWRVQFVKPDGTRSTKRGFRTKTEADMWITSNDHSRLTGSWVDPALGKTRVEQVGARWLAAQTHLKAETYRVTESTWRIHIKPHWGSRQLSSIRKSEVQEWVAGFEQGPSTAKRALQCLAQILDVAVDDGMLAKNPARGIKQPKKPPPRLVYLSMEQVRRLADECSHRSEVVWLLATTGMRWSELAGLKVKDLDLDGRRIHLQRAAVTVEAHDGKPRQIVVDTLKGHENRKIAAPRFVCNMLAEVIEGKGAEDWVWEKAAGGPMWKLGEGDWYYEALDRLRRPPNMREAERDLRAKPERLKERRDARFPRVTPHGLRHVAASLLVGSGAHVKVVQKQLGHSSAAMTLDTYADLFDGDLDEVADAMEGLHSDLSQSEVSHEAALVRAVRS